MRDSSSPFSSFPPSLPSLSSLFFWLLLPSRNEAGIFSEGLRISLSTFPGAAHPSSWLELISGPFHRPSLLTLNSPLSSILSFLDCCTLRVCCGRPLAKQIRNPFFSIHFLFPRSFLYPFSPLSTWDEPWTERDHRRIRHAPPILSFSSLHPLRPFPTLILCSFGEVVMMVSDRGRAGAELRSLSSPFSFFPFFALDIPQFFLCPFPPPYFLAEASELASRLDLVSRPYHAHALTPYSPSSSFLIGAKGLILLLVYPLPVGRSVASEITHHGLICRVLALSPTLFPLPPFFSALFSAPSVALLLSYFASLRW